jgi:regulation of enolase protein 1 (concanavalin A-like superfamily)
MQMEKSVIDSFKWINESKALFVDGKLIIKAPEKSDFFYNNGATSETGITPESLCNAPFHYMEVTGDFVMRLKVSHDFKDTYDAAAVMIMQDLQVWAKLCFEKTDFDTHAVVSVVTNHTSDDANGCNVDGNTVWLQIARVDNAFSFHYSLDGKKFDMTRFFTLPVDKTIKVGFVAQAPTGKGGDRIYENFSLENKTVANIRYGK